MINEWQQASIRQIQPQRLHVFNTSLTLDEWEKAGRPAIWTVAEVSGRWTVVLDAGYGLIGLLREDRCIEIARNTIVYGDIIAVDRNYYGSSGYLYKHES